MNLEEAFRIICQHRNDPRMPWALQPDHVCNQRHFHWLRDCSWGVAIDENGAWAPPDVYTEADARRDTPEALTARLRSDGPFKPT
jgi:hypothetical protein